MFPLSYRAALSVQAVVKTGTVLQKALRMNKELGFQSFFVSGLECHEGQRTLQYRAVCKQKAIQKSWRAKSKQTGFVEKFFFGKSTRTLLH